MSEYYGFFFVITCTDGNFTSSLEVTWVSLNFEGRARFHIGSYVELTQFIEIHYGNVNYQVMSTFFLSYLIGRI